MEGETGGGENGDLPSNRYGAVSLDDCPQIFPYFVAQFYDMASQYPGILSGSKNAWIAEICGKSCYHAYQQKLARHKKAFEIVGGLPT